MLRREADKAAAGLGAAPVAGTYAGLRPATDSADYRIELVEGRQWVSCGRIERVVAQNVRLPSVAGATKPPGVPPLRSPAQSHSVRSQWGGSAQPA